jgi:hypothetical protein
MVWREVGMGWLLSLALSVAVAGPAPELPTVLQQTASWRALRQARGVPRLTSEQLARVAAGEIVTGLVEVEGEAAKRSWAVGVLDQPIARVWGAISDESLHPAYTDLDYAEVVRGRACESGRHVLQYLPSPVPLVKDRWWVTIRTHNDALEEASGGRMRELVFRNAPDGSEVASAEGRARLAQGMMVGFTRGAWVLTAIGSERTLVEYDSQVDPGGALSPSLLTMFAGRTLRTTLESMERLARDPRLHCVR